MNNAWKSVLGVVAVLAVNVTPHALAQQKANGPDMPTPPYVAAVPDFFQWTITVTDKGAPPPPKSDPTNPSAPKQPGAAIAKKIIYTKTKDIVCNVVLFANGKHSEIWYDHGSVLTRSPSGEKSIDNTAGAAYISDMASTGFLGVDWVSLDKFIGKIATKDGGAAFTYRTESTPPPPNMHMPQFVLDEVKKHPQKQNPVIREAMIAADTMLPLIVVDGGRTYEYSYQPPPTAMLQLPPDLAQMVTDTIKQRKYAEALRALGQQ